MTPEKWQKLIDQYLKDSILLMSGGKTEDVCAPILKLAVEEAGCCLAECWTINPRDQKLIRVAELPAGLAPGVRRNPTLSFRGTATGKAVLTKRPEFFDLDDESDLKHPFLNRPLLIAIGARYLLSVPILTTGNPHQALCVLNFFFPKRFLASIVDKEFLRFVQQMSRLLAAAIEANLRERGYCSAMILTANLASISTTGGKAEASKVLAMTLKDTLNAERVDVFLYDQPAEKLRLESSDGTSDPDPILTLAEANSVFGENRERIQGVGPTDSTLLIPMQLRSLPDPVGINSKAKNFSGLDRPQGIVVIQKSVRSSSKDISPHYNFDDVAVADAVLQSFSPSLSTIVSARNTRFLMTKLSHELKVPIEAFGGILQQMETECHDQSVSFQYPYFNEAWIYHDLMSRLLRELDIVRIGPSNIPMRFRWANLLTDIIAPLKRFMTPLMREHEFFRHQVTFDGFDVRAEFLIDIGLVTQLLFNLVGNAMKHYGDTEEWPKSEFHCKLIGAEEYLGFKIKVTNNGAGVDAKVAVADRIFDLGVRGDVSSPGEGFGLWIAKAIAERHGGTLELTHRVNPTEFVFTIPWGRIRYKKGRRP